MKKLLAIKIKLRFRDPGTYVAMFALPIMLVVMNSFMISGGDAQSMMQIFLPGGIAMILLVEFDDYMIYLVMGKDRGISRRVATIPISRARYLASEIMAMVSVTALGLCFFMGVMLALGVRIEGSWIQFIAVILLTIFSLLALGSAMAGFLKSEGTAFWLGFVLIFLMLFLAFVPEMALPDAIRPFVAILPTSSMSYAHYEIITGTGTLSSNLENVVIPVVWAVGCGALAAFTFRWE